MPVRFHFFSLLLASILLLFLSCDKTPKSQFSIGFSQCCQDDWRKMMEDEMKRELAFHPEVDFLMEVANHDSQIQVEQIKILLEKGIDLLIVAPNQSEPLTPIIEKVYQSGVPVILIDRKTASEKYTAYIGADNFEIGQTAAHYLANRFQQKGKIIELQMPLNTSPAIERSRGFRQALQSYPNMEIVDSLELENYIESLAEKLPNSLQKHSNAQILFGHTDLISETAYKLLTDKIPQRLDSLFFVGVDGIPGTGKGIEAVEEGILDASLLYPTGGSEAIRLAMKILTHQDFEKKNLLETTVIDSTNARILNLQFQKVGSLQARIDAQKELIEDQIITYNNLRTYIFILISSLLLALILGAMLWKALIAKEQINESLEAKNKEVLRQQKQLVEMSEEVRKVTQTKFRFFTNISHEFRTPLTLILGAVEWYDKENKIADKELQKDLGIIRKNAIRLLRLVNQLMDFRKIDRNKMLAQVSETDLLQFTKDIMEVFQRTAEKRQIDFQLHSQEKTLKVWVDKNMMDKELFNLLSNAFKFTPNGAYIHLSIVKNESANEVVISIEDSGIGMNETQLKHAFERFYQGDKKNMNGTGLGLAFSKELVSLHKGNIEVSSQEGKGTKFEIRLLLGNQHFEEQQIHHEKRESTTYEDYSFYVEEKVENATQGTSITTSQQTAEHSLLLIDDNDDLRTFLKHKLQNDYHILEAENGRKAWEIATEEVPDLIICDVMMPEMDGLSFSKKLKSDLRTSHIPIILLTAKSTEEQKVKGIKTGADTYITKPFHLPFLLENIKTLLFNRNILKQHFLTDNSHTTAIKEKLQNTPPINELDRQFIEQFTQFIKANYKRQEFGMSDIQQEFGLSRTQVYRKVKALIGQTVSDYIKALRMEKAKELIEEGSLNISEIAYEVGYSSPSYFSTVFKGYFGESPSEFKA